MKSDDTPPRSYKPRYPAWIRLVALVTAQIFFLEQAAWAAPSSKSIFAGKQASHTAVRERNLRELEAKQGMLQKQGQGAGDKGRTTNDGRRPTASLSLASL